MDDLRMVLRSCNSALLIMCCRSLESQSQSEDLADITTGGLSRPPQAIVFHFHSTTRNN
jgi:hypothetical protein